MKSYYPKKNDFTHTWHLVDLKGKVLGRAATEIARILLGKNNPKYTPSAESYQFVVAINADQIALTGRKWENKKYHRHTGYFGGVKTATAQEVLERDSRRLIETAVRGMLPKTALGRHIMKKFKVYKGAEHAHAAQSPKETAI